MIYDVLDIPYIVDGDSLWVVRQWSVGDLEGFELLGRDYAGGAKVRLDDGDKGLNTPEKRKDPFGWGQARHDLINYVEVIHARDPLEFVRTNPKLDSFARILGDIRVKGDPNALTAVEYMIIQGWEPYKK